jgi:hypothetical protein
MGVDQAVDTEGPTDETEFMAPSGLQNAGLPGNAGLI